MHPFAALSAVRLMAMVQPWCSSTHGTAEGPHLPTAADANGMLAIQRAHTCGNGKTSVLQDDNHINHCPKLKHNMCTYHECSSHASTTGFFRFPWVCFQPESWIDVPSYYSNFRCPHVPPCAHAGFPTDSHRVQVLKSWIQIWDH